MNMELSEMSVKELVNKVDDGDNQDVFGEIRGRLERIGILELREATLIAAANDLRAQVADEKAYFKSFVEHHEAEEKDWEEDKARALKAEAELAEKSRMIAQADELLLKATQKVGMEPRGCDTADALADEIVELRDFRQEAWDIIGECGMGESDRDKLERIERLLLDTEK